MLCTVGKNEAAARRQVVDAALDIRPRTSMGRAEGQHVLRMPTPPPQKVMSLPKLGLQPFGVHPLAETCTGFRMSKPISNQNPGIRSCAAPQLVVEQLGVGFSS